MTEPPKELANKMAEAIKQGEVDFIEQDFDSRGEDDEGPPCVMHDFEDGADNCAELAAKVAEEHYKNELDLADDANWEHVGFVMDGGDYEEPFSRVLALKEKVSDELLDKHPDIRPLYAWKKSK